MDKSEIKTVYSYDETGVLVGSHNLNYTDRSQISGAWQIPGNMTDIVPPVAKEGFTIHFSGDNWEYKEIPKPSEETPTVTIIDTPQVDETVLALATALATQEERIANLEKTK